MKTIILTIATFLTLNLSAQNTTPVTRAEVNEINLRLDGLEKFGRQHRTGNHLMIAGTILSGLGSWMYINNYNGYNPPKNNANKATYLKQYRMNRNISQTIMGMGGVMITTGVIINIDSYRHLRKNTDR